MTDERGGEQKPVGSLKWSVGPALVTAGAVALVASHAVLGGPVGWAVSGVGLLGLAGLGVRRAARARLAVLFGLVCFGLFVFRQVYKWVEDPSGPTWVTADWGLVCALFGLGMMASWSRPTVPLRPRVVAAVIALGLLLPVGVTAGLIQAFEHDRLDVTTAETPVVRYGAPPLQVSWYQGIAPFDSLVPGALFPVAASPARLIGLDLDGENVPRWQVGFDRGALLSATASGGEIVMHWEAHPYATDRQTRQRQAVVVAGSGKVLLDTARPDGTGASVTLPGLLVRTVCPAGADPRLEGLSFDDRVLWSVPFAGCTAGSLLRIGDALLAPVEGGTAIQRIGADGRPRWTWRGGGRVTAVRDGGGSILAFDAGGTVTAIDPGTGAERWRAPHSATELAAAADGTVVWSAAEGGELVLHGHDAVTGAERWARASGRAAQRSVAIGYGAAVVVLSDLAERPTALVVARADGLVLGTNDIVPVGLYGTPMVSGGLILLADRDGATAGIR